MASTVFLLIHKGLLSVNNDGATAIQSPDQKVRAFFAGGCGVVWFEVKQLQQTVTTILKMPYMGVFGIAY